MNLGGIFANAIVRILAYVLVAIALAWCGIGRAEAAICGIPTLQEAATAAGSGTTYAYEGQAKAACLSLSSPFIRIIGLTNYVFEANGTCEPAGSGNKQFYHAGTHIGNINPSTCTLNGASGGSGGQQGWAWTTPGCPPGTQWSENLKQCMTPCDSNGPALPAGSGFIAGAGSSPASCSSRTCAQSCEYSQDSLPGSFNQSYLVIDGIAHCDVSGWMPTGQNCLPGVGNSGPPPSAPPADSDGDGTSDGNDGAPNNPGQGGGGNSDGEGPPEDGSGTCGGEGQPACGSPGTGSGNGNTSGGGGDCNTPPTSTGDAILAQIAYQAWATRCAIMGTGNAGPGGGGTGTGEGSGSGGEVDGDAEGRDAAMDGSENDPERDDVVEEAPSEEDGELDMSGYGYSRACVASPTVSVFGQTITFDTGPMCQWLELGSYFVLLLAALASARIISGGMA